MRQLILLFAIASIGWASYGQEAGLPIYPNGLIYSSGTMSRLKFIVDSLQLKFRHCDLSRDYYSVRQGKGHAVSLDSGNIRMALADIRRGIGYEEFIKKYPQAGVDSFILVTEQEYGNEAKEKLLRYTNQTATQSRLETIEIVKDRETDSSKWGISGKKGSWVFDYTHLLRHKDEKIKAFYLLQEPSSEKMRDVYARLVLYTDCMTDTATTVYYKDANSSGRWDIFSKRTGKPSADAQNAFWEYVDLNTKRYFPKPSRGKWKSEPLRYDSLRDVFIKDSLSSRPLFKQLLATAVEDALRFHRVTGDIFERYTEIYYSRSAALQMKRNRIVIGSCSMDPSPRNHAMKIAQLAAETADWSVFLKAHLDIMNDRFDRASDGTYAWGGRKTYLKELEDLDLDVTDLLLGISLRMADPSENHYFGNIGRLGRALAETKDRTQLEEKILAMIRDTTLDDYNRLIQHYLFLNYMYYLPAKESRLTDMEKLVAADKTMPAYISSHLKINHEFIDKGLTGSLW
ncbi:MAG: hypothetical protein J0H74_14940 [Chitinophagaceae bacterium]|nr:hypothetical protein [Chitinophagaceae bacterium]